MADVVDFLAGKLFNKILPLGDDFRGVIVAFVAGDAGEVLGAADDGVFDFEFEFAEGRGLEADL